MNNPITYTMQIISAQEQLTEAFSLRYQIYKTAYPLLVAHHTDPYEWDAFDKRSIHVGLYCTSNNEKKLAGYCRLICRKNLKNHCSI